MPAVIDGMFRQTQQQRVVFGGLEADQLQTGTSAGTAGLVGAVTLNSPVGLVTSDSITIPAGMGYSLTVTNSYILSTSDIVIGAVWNGTNTGGFPTVGRSQPSVGAVTMTIVNAAVTNPDAVVSGTLKLGFVVINNSTGATNP